MMESRTLMSGIAVVIDDRIRPADATAEEPEDPIVGIVQQLENDWKLPFYRSPRLPPDDMWPSLLEAASFVLLDWELWPKGAASLEQDGIEQNIKFLRKARSHFIPVFVFTNTTYEEIDSRIPDDLYDSNSPSSQFILVRRKADLLKDGVLDFSAIDQWIAENASVYTLKTWSRVFNDARRDLFGSMYSKNRDWPRVFWNAYVDDGVDPSGSLTTMISDSLRGRMRLNAFDGVSWNDKDVDVDAGEIRSLIAETWVSKQLSDGEVRCGDLFQRDNGSYLLNVRPDCDCVPRSGRIDRVRLFCIEGSEVSPSDCEYRDGQFAEKPWQSIVIATTAGSYVEFDFKKLCIKRFSELKDKRVGRLMHPYLTRIQQRYASYQQRQALPRMPTEANPAAYPTQ